MKLVDSATSVASQEQIKKGTLSPLEQILFHFALVFVDKKDFAETTYNLSVSQRLLNFFMSMTSFEGTGFNPEWLNSPIPDKLFKTNLADVVEIGENNIEYEPFCKAKHIIRKNVDMVTGEGSKSVAGVPAMLLRSFKERLETINLVNEIALNEVLSSKEVIEHLEMLASDYFKKEFIEIKEAIELPVSTTALIVTSEPEAIVSAIEEVSFQEEIELKRAGVAVEELVEEIKQEVVIPEAVPAMEVPAELKALESLLAQVGETKETLTSIIESEEDRTNEVPLSEPVEVIQPEPIAEPKPEVIVESEPTPSPIPEPVAEPVIAPIPEPELEPAAVLVVETTPVETTAKIIRMTEKEKKIAAPIDSRLEGDITKVISKLNGKPFSDRGFAAKNKNAVSRNADAQKHQETSFYTPISHEVAKSVKFQTWAFPVGKVYIPRGAEKKRKETLEAQLKKEPNNKRLKALLDNFSDNSGKLGRGIFSLIVGKESFSAIRHMNNFPDNYILPEAYVIAKLGPYSSATITLPYILNLTLKERQKGTFVCTLPDAEFVEARTPILVNPLNFVQYQEAMSKVASGKWSNMGIYHFNSRYSNANNTMWMVFISNTETPIRMPIDID